MKDGGNSFIRPNAAPGEAPGAHIPRRRHIDFTVHDQSGVVILRTNIEERAVSLARYIVDNRATVRAAARHFGVSKSTVHMDVA